MTKAILTLNAGSASLKFALFTEDLQQTLKGKVEETDTASRLRATDMQGNLLADRTWPGPSQHDDLLATLLDWIESLPGADGLAAVSHRIVHGGRNFHGPTLLDAPAITALDSLSPLAPLHQRHNLNAVRAIARRRPGLTQIGCFDTAFHHTMPAVATRFALPRAFEEAGVRRYGFHGLSYEYIAGKMREIAPAFRKVIVAHLGNGASLCALKDGRSVDTTMGFSALDGLVMGTRCGALDPGVVLYLMQTRGMTAAAVEDLLYRRSGLLGISGVSSDMRTLLTSDDGRANEAVDLFVFHAARQVAALAATLQGFDALVFTAGIGENSALIRKRICAQCAWLGIDLDPAENEKSALKISTSKSPVAAFAVPTNEELILARQAVGYLRNPVAEDRPV